MNLDPRFWAPRFQTKFITEINTFMRVLEERLLPGFSEIESEAEAIQNEEWSRLLSTTYSEDGDCSEIAEQSVHAGITYYEQMTETRQSVINLFASGLYHLFEQQVMFFHRKQVLSLSEENDKGLFKLEVFQERLRCNGVEVAEFGCWSKIEELRLVANVVKHAAGKSSEGLIQVRPDLFSPTCNQESLPSFPGSSDRVFMPLGGNDLYVSHNDILRYQKAVIAFWDELSEAILNR